jgi:preprotein translocase subunit SecA
LVEYDDVANQQREIVYKLRRRVLESSNLEDEVKEKLFHQMDKVYLYSTDAQSETLDEEKLIVGMLDIIPFDEVSKERVKEEIKKISDEEKRKQLLRKVIEDVHKQREKQAGEDVMRQIEKFAYLGAIDSKWIDHIDHIDGLREGVRLRGYAQRDPIAEFKNEAYGLFEGLLDRIDEELGRRIFRIGMVQARRPEIPLDAATTNVDTSDQQGLAEAATPELGAEKGASAFSPPLANSPQTTANKNAGTTNLSSRKKLGRNDPCWCNSGKKWKKCHYPQHG